MTISISIVVSFCIALLLTTVVPLVLLLVLGLKKKLSVIPMLVGASAFFVSQMILRLPIMSILSTQKWYQDFASNYMILFVIVVGGFTAGLFEESARLGGAKLLKQQTAYKDAISFGLGHAFCEVILINGMMNVNNVIYSLLLLSGDTGLLSNINAQQIADSLIATTPMMIALGVFERLPSIAFHVFATLLIFKGVNERKISYYFYAILAHTFLNSSIVLISQYTNPYIGEAVLLVFGILMVIYIIKVKSKFKSEQNSIMR